MSAIITAENITFRYSEGKDIIKNLSLEIEEGDFVAILGHNGSGKSTFAKHLNAILTPSEGKVTVAGLDTSDDNNLAQIRRTVGMVFQNPDNQIIATVVEEDVAFALENLGVEQNEMIRRVDEALETVGMLKFKKHSTTQLSGGQKQRIAIAGVIAMNPRIIVLDEPTAMLDPQGREDVIKTVKKLNEQGVTVVLITHYMDEAAQAKRVVVIDEGEILIDGTPHYVFQNAGLLTSVGLDVPQSTSLMFLLRRYGVKVPLAVLTEDECISVLSDILTRKNAT
ncbi:MAG: energy-coupling factor transporter ATPase [Clostridia bacterium]|nr:energy-coupling factor transporter ATPase [Clostridia bacterium]MBO5299184.1 energy-coupling factor transporter ATPase [Clostridia bacterium]